MERIVSKKAYICNAEFHWRNYIGDVQMLVGGPEGLLVRIRMRVCSSQNSSY